jgi:hypothetical protein
MKSTRFGRRTPRSCKCRLGFRIIFALLTSDLVWHPVGVRDTAVCFFLFFFFAVLVRERPT